MSDSESRASALLAAADQGACQSVMKLLLDAAESERTELRKVLLNDLRQRLSQVLAQLQAPFEIDETEEGPEPFAPAEDSPAPAIVHDSGEIQKFLEGVKREQLRARALQLAIVGIGARKEVESALFAVRPNTFMAEDPGFWILALKLLAARKTEWQGPVIIRALEGKSKRWEDYRVLQARLKRGMVIVRDGVLPADTLLPYLSRLARQSNTFDFKSELGRRVVWAALEALDEPFVGNSFYDPTHLIESLGRTERPRLVALALERLGQQSRGQHVNWWAQVVEALKLTPREWEEHRDTALDLANAATARAVGIGIAGIRVLYKDGLLTPAVLVPVLQGAVQVETQGTARTVIQLLRASAGQDASVREEATIAALGGLTHPKTGVQDAVLNWLEEESDWRKEPAVVLVLTDLVETLTGPAGIRLSRILSREEFSEVTTGNDANSATSGDLLETLGSQLESLLEAEQEPERRDWLENCRLAITGAGRVPESCEDLRLLWRCDAPLAYPAGAEETARLILSINANRRCDFPTRARLFAGMAQPVPDAERSFIRRLLDPIREDYYFGRYARVWLGAPNEDDIEAMELLGYPMDGGALCLPTHKAGWLDPMVFAQRLMECAPLKGDDWPKLAAALYRLPSDPQAQAAAWETLAPVVGRHGPEVASAVRLALAPEAVPERAWGEALADSWGDWRRMLLLSAARRCRIPGEDGTWLAPIFERLSSHTERRCFKDEALSGGYGNPLSNGSFDWPAGVQALVEHVLAKGGYQWADSLIDAMRSAVRPDIRVRHLLPKILELAADENVRVRGSAVDLVINALADGRVYAQDLFEHLSPRLRVSASRPRVLLVLLSRLADTGEPYRAIAACCLEMALAGGLGGLSGADRAALFEALLQWHSAAGRTIEDASARTLIEAVAAERKKNRSVELARQLMQLPASSNHPPMRRLGTCYDMTLALERSGLPIGPQSQSE